MAVRPGRSTGRSPTGEPDPRHNGPVDLATDGLTIADNPAESRFEARLGERVVGIAEYELNERRIVFVHTEVDPSIEGRGIGGRLARGALDEARSRGLAVTVECPFISSFLRRHAREYPDLVGGAS